MLSRPLITEVRATLSLAWPLILANLTMALIQATDVLLMGRLGARPLAASALGINLNFALSLICLGLVTASSPMIATALGRRSNNIRDVRRTFRQSMWLIATVTPPVWLILWHSEAIIISLGQDPGLAQGAATFLRGYMWSMLPFLAFQAMRNFVSALERPGWVLVISLAGIVLNALLGWAMIFGHLGFPAMGLFGGGLASSIVWTLLMIALAVVIKTDPQFRRFHLFGRWWRPDWPRYRRMWLLGLPIGLAMGFEGGVFSAACLSDGPDQRRRRRRPRRRAPDRGFVVHGAVGHGAGGDGARRSRARARRPRRYRPRRVERLGDGDRLHGRHGNHHLAHSPATDDPVPRG
jgi:MATE family multidrug resistance protein